MTDDHSELILKLRDRIMDAFGTEDAGPDGIRAAQATIAIAGVLARRIEALQARLDALEARQ